jgi:hypothetical protein
MSRVFRLWLPMLVLASVLLQSIGPVVPGWRAFDGEATAFVEKGDLSETDADPAKDVCEDDDDTKTIHVVSVRLLSGQSRDSETWLNSLFDQHRPKSFVPPPRG